LVSAVDAPGQEPSRWRRQWVLGQLLSRHPKLDHQPLFALFIDKKMAMEEDAAVFLKVCARDGFAPGMFGIEGRGPQHDVPTVEGAVALANRHCGLVRVVPHGREAIRFGIETGDSGAGGFRSVSIREGEIRLEKLPVLDHVLFTCAIRYDRLPVHREEGLDDVPVASKLPQQLLTSSRRVRRLILIVGLLRDRGSGH
jgi:hypothetical protein